MHDELRQPSVRCLSFCVTSDASKMVLPADQSPGNKNNMRAGYLLPIAIIIRSENVVNQSQTAFLCCFPTATSRECSMPWPMVLDDQ